MELISREKVITMLKRMTEHKGYVELTKVLEFEDDVCDRSFCEDCMFESPQEHSSGCKLVDYFEGLQKFIPSMQEMNSGEDMRGEE